MSRYITATMSEIFAFRWQSRLTCSALDLPGLIGSDIAFACRDEEEVPTISNEKYVQRRIVSLVIEILLYSRKSVFLFFCGES